MSIKEQKPKLTYWDSDSFFTDLDVVIIGSGIVGVNAALALKEKDPKLKVAIFERGPLPTGASTRNAGFACFGSISELLEDMEHRTEDEVFKLVERRWKGLLKLRERTGNQAIDYQSYGGYELFREESVYTFERCASKISAFNERMEGFTGVKDVFSVGDNKIGDMQFGDVKHLIYNKLEGQLHPGKMMKILINQAHNAGVFFNFGMDIEKIYDAGSHVVLVNDLDWEIKAKKIIVATNGFSKKLLPKLDIVPHRNLVLITHPVKDLTIRGTFHYDRGYYYFRNVDDRILIGGGRHLASATEQTEAFGVNNFIQSALVQLLRTVVLPGKHFEIDRVWSGILGLGSRKDPIVMKVSDRIIAAVRLGGMGIAIGSQVGCEAADLVLDEVPS